MDYKVKEAINEFNRRCIERNQRRQRIQKQIQRALVRIVYAPEIVEEADSIKMTYSDKIDNVSETAKSSIKTIANQIDSGLVGQFGEKVKAQVDLNKGSYDDL